MNTTVTYEERQLMALCNEAGTRTGLIGNLQDMREYLDAGDGDLLALTDSAIEKLSAMSDADFAALDLVPDFDAENNEVE